MRFFILIISLFIFTAVACALSLRPQSQLELVGTSDLIVVGAITSFATTPSTEEYRAGIGTATVSIERTIKGAEQKTMKIVYPAPPRKEGMDWGVNFEKDQKVLLFLENKGGHYTLVTPRGVQSPEAANQIAELAGQFPVEVTMSGLLTITPGKTLNYTMTIHNKGESALMYLGTSVRALLLQDKQLLNIDISQPGLIKTAGNADLLIKPGQTKTFATTFSPLIPTPITNNANDQLPQIEIRASAWLRIARPEDTSRSYLENIPITLGFFVSAPRSIITITPATKMK